MNIVLATDDNFVQHCGTTIKSITENNRGIIFYILTEGLTANNAQLLKDVASNNGCCLEFRFVPTDIVKYFPMSKMASNHISVATYYRLFVTTLLPQEVDKIIYLDCDMIIRGSLTPLWNKDLSDTPLAAVYQHNGWADHENSWSRLNIPREFGYFNAGCLLLNLDYLRKINFQQLAVNYINEHFDRIISHDQDVLNALFYDKVKMLECKWNYLPLFVEKDFDSAEFPSKCNYKEEKNQNSFSPIIIHFVSKPKPWNYGCENPYTSEYYKYLEMTPWRGYKPKFTIKAFYDYKLVPTVKKSFKKIDKLNILGRLYHLYKERK